MLMHTLAGDGEDTPVTPPGTPPGTTPVTHLSHRIESTALALTVLYAAAAGPHLVSHSATVPWLAATATLAAVLIALSAIDARTFRLPDRLTLPLLAAGLALAALDGSAMLVWHAASAMLGAALLWAVNALYRRLRGTDGLGFGDVKLFAGAGAWAGAEGLASVLLVACGAALALVAIWRLRDPNLAGSTALPFGPFLAFGLWIVWLYGPLT